LNISLQKSTEYALHLVLECRLLRAQLECRLAAWVLDERSIKRLNRMSGRGESKKSALGCCSKGALMSDRSFPYPSASFLYCINLDISINAGGRSTCHGNGKQKYFEDSHAGEETNNPVVLLQRLNNLEMSPKTTSQIANQSNQRTTVRLLMTALMHTDTEKLFENTNKLHTTFFFATARDHKICAMNNFFDGP